MFYSRRSGVDTTVICPVGDIPPEVYSVTLHTRPSRVAEWAELVGDSVPDSDEDDPEPTDRATGDAT
jgi:hypothetical protein